MVLKARTFAGWDAVATEAASWRYRDRKGKPYLDKGQVKALKVIATSMKQHGMVLADEVGMGKTRIAVALALAVKRCGGRVAIVVPTVVGPQWQEEFRDAGEDGIPGVLSSFDGLVAEYAAGHPQRRDSAIVMLSQRFANIQLGTKGVHWRADLLKRVVREVEPGLRSGIGVDEARKGMETLASSVYAAASPSTRARIVERFKKIPNRAQFDDPDSGRFGTGVELELLEQCIGLALGPFDLVIIDEAHKARCGDSKLSVLLKRVIIERKSGSSPTRRLGMTATPVELDVSQWQSTLMRVGMEPPDWERISPAVRDFRDAANAVRLVWRTDEQARRNYIDAARAFQQSLAPWIVRRDKRHDDVVQTFRKHAGENADYRRKSVIEVALDPKSKSWCRAVLAAEALSVIGQSAAGTKEARTRLTISNGHGVAGIIDKLRSAKEGPEADEDRAQQAEDEKDNEIEGAPEDYLTGKRRQRAAFWERAIQAEFTSVETSLYDHPVLTRVVEEIETLTAKGEKVLIFGRYTKPMAALTDLLNARALLRAVRDGTPWPHGQIDDAQGEALKFAAGTMGITESFETINEKLDRDYKAFENARKALRDHIARMVDNPAKELSAGLSGLLREIRDDLRRDDDSHPDNVIALLARAIEPMLPEHAKVSQSLVEDAFSAFTKKLFGDDGSAISTKSPKKLWRDMRGALDEYGGQRANYAYRLHGNTQQATRRVVQLAFNRAASEPHVLVAQSMVGREGLNLHESCSTVILLHLEWNPAVVEQQIGRVDRKNSHWANKVEEAIGAGKNLPRIDFHPVVFQGTYDEHHWSVLERRWEEQRSQLHGEVASAEDREHLTGADQKVLRRLERSSPDFSPDITIRQKQRS